MNGADSAPAAQHSDSVLPALSERGNVVLYTLLSLVLVVGGHRTWREYHRYVEAAARRTRIQRLVEASKREAKVGVVVDAAATGSVRAQEPPEPGPLKEEPTATALEADNALTPTPAPRQTKRSKERRRRGRDVCKDVLKNERKKEKAPAGRASSNSPLPTATTLLAGDYSPAPRSASLVGSSRSSSSVRPLSEYEAVENTPRPGSTDWSAAAESGQDTRSDYSSMSESVSSIGLGTQASSQTSEENKLPFESISLTPPTSTSTTVGAASLSSPLALVAEASEPTSDSTPSDPPSDLQKLQWVSSVPGSPSHSHASTSLVTTDMDWEQGAHAIGMSNKSSPPRFRSVSRSEMSSSSRSVSTSARSPCPTPPPTTSLQVQVNSLKGALEASRRREEKHRREIDKFKQECEMLRYHWNQDSERRKRRETELEAQLQHVTSQFQSLSLSVSHMQMQAYQQQGSFSVHSPMPFSYPATGVSSPNSGSLPLAQHPYSFFPNDPRMGYRRASSSNVTSPTREASRPAFADDVSAQLAEAILKRPEQVRSSPAESLSEQSYSVAGSVAGGSRSGSVAGRATRDGFTFASLSELGNPQSRRSVSPSSEYDVVVPGDSVHDENIGSLGERVSHDAADATSLGDSVDAPDDSTGERGDNDEFASNGSGNRKASLEAFLPAPVPMESRALSVPGWQLAASEYREPYEPTPDSGKLSLQDDATREMAAMERAATYGEEGRRGRYGTIASA